MESGGIDKDIQFSYDGKEQELQSRASWLGGVFEAGGHLSFLVNKNVKNGKEYIYGYPLMVLADKQEDRIDKLRSMFGGTKQFSATSRGWEWRLTGEKAANIASLIAPFSVSRAETILAIENWENADIEERLQIAREMQGVGRSSEASAESYQKAMNITPFVAGIIDYKGSFSVNHPKPGSKVGNQTVRVYNTNRNLLEALRLKFGGRVRLGNPKGSQKVINHKSFVSLKDNYYWAPDFSDTRRFIELVRPHMILAQRKIDLSIS